MKKEDLLKAMGQIDDDLIMAADDFRKKKRKFPIVRFVTAVAAVCVLVIGIYGAVNIIPKITGKNDVPVADNDTDTDVTKPGKNNFVDNMESISEKFVLSEVKYPEMTAYPIWDDIENGIMTNDEYGESMKAWKEDVKKQTEQYEGYNEGMEEFYGTIAKELLANNQYIDIAKENIVCSPINIFIALSMLAEVSAEDDRATVLDILGVDDIDELRKKVSALWNVNYRDDTVSTLLLGNSLWLNEANDYNKNTINSLADNYFASVYKGEMGSNAYNEAYKTWINNNTGDMLKDYVYNSDSLSEDIVFALVSTIYFSDKWREKFDTTEEDVFYSPEGDMEIDFLVNEKQFYDYYIGDGYEVVRLRFREMGYMDIILPDEGKSLQEIAENDKEFIKVLTEFGGGYDDKLKSSLLNLRIPKFSVGSEISLEESLRNLGAESILDGFDSELAGYIDWVSLRHVTKVEVDEEGCRGAAFTEMLEGVGIYEDKQPIDVTVDRPFFFTIKNNDGTILFAGAVNDPSK